MAEASEVSSLIPAAKRNLIHPVLNLSSPPVILSKFTCLTSALASFLCRLNSAWQPVQGTPSSKASSNPCAGSECG